MANIKVSRIKMWTSNRTCTVCRTTRPRAELIRFVADARGHLRVDPLVGLPGRGVYTCPTARCVGAGVGKGGFARGLRRRLHREDPERFIEKTATTIQAELSMMCSKGLADGRAKRIGEELEATDQRFAMRLAALLEQHQGLGVEVSGGGQLAQDPSRWVTGGGGRDTKMHEGQRADLPADGRD